MENILDELWLIWQHPQTGRCYHIGTLTYEHGTSTFVYEQADNESKLAGAVESGYRPHLGFPDIGKIYRSPRLFGPFARRLPDRRRPDYAKILRGLGFPVDSMEMRLLKETGGILATDSYQFVLPGDLGKENFS